MNVLELYLEELECDVCHHVGMEQNSEDGFICPSCGKEGSMYYSFMNGVLSEKGCHCCDSTRGFQILNEHGSYACDACSYMGNIYNEIPMPAYNY